MADELQRSDTPAAPLRQDLLLIASFLVMALLLLAFVHIAGEITEADTLALDRRILLGLRRPEDLAMPIGPVWLRAAMIDATALGGPWVLTVLTTLVAGFLLAVRRPATAAFLTASVAGGAVLSLVLKHGFIRARPDVVPHLVAVDTTSFPSGHAMNSAVVYMTLGVLLSATQPTRTARLYLIGAAILITLLVGVSRAYLGVHWPSDVLAGWCVGAGWALFCAVLARLLRYSKRWRADMRRPA